LGAAGGLVVNSIKDCVKDVLVWQQTDWLTITPAEVS
jgi:hypothetical protein